MPSALMMTVRRVFRSRAFRLLLVRAGPAVATSAVNLARHGQWRQLAILHADSLVDGRFSREVLDDGAVHWVVWQQDRPVASYPPFDGTLEEALTGHDPAIRRRPEDLPSRRARTAGTTGARRVGHRVGRLRQREQRD